MNDDSGSSSTIQQTAEEKDLGVHLAENLKPSIQCVRSAAKARSVVGNGKQEFQETRQRRFLAHIQDVLPASHGVLCSLFRHGHLT